MSHAANDPLRISDDGLALIEQFEGFEPDWYLDAVGVRTIAFGWTHALPDGFAPPLTRAQGRRLLRDTIGRYESAVRDLVAVPLNQSQFDALVSFTYNLGRGALASSTLLRKLNGGQPDVGPEFDRWVKAGGRVLKGLVRRRAAERKLFESDAKPVRAPADPTATPPGDSSPASDGQEEPSPPGEEAGTDPEATHPESTDPRTPRRDFERIHPAAPHFLDRDLNES